MKMNEPQNLARHIFKAQEEGQDEQEEEEEELEVEEKELAGIERLASEVSPLSGGTLRQPWEGSPARPLGRRASIKSQRMLARESSKFRGLKSKKALNDEPHEY